MISMISAYFSLVIDINFWITSYFSIHLMQLTSKVQMPISCLFMNKNKECEYAFSTLVPKYFRLQEFFDFAFSAPPASVSKAMHITFVT